LARKIRGKTTLPLAVGFGIETRRDVRALSDFFDGIIIGSAFLKRMIMAKGKAKPAIAFVKSVFS
jgi:tryptophan synthase alpha chain